MSGDYKPNWWGIGGLILLMLVMVMLWRRGVVAAKWFVVLLITGTVLARWENTFKPWLFGGERKP